MPEEKVKKEMNKEVESIVDLDQDKNKLDYSILNRLSVWENLNPLNNHDLKNRFPSDFLTVMVVTKGEGIANIDMEEVHLKKNSLILMSPNTLVDSSVKNKEMMMSGVSFTIDFLSDTEVPKRNAEVLTYFSPRFSSVWELESEDASLVGNQIQQLKERVKKYATHPYGREVLTGIFNVFLFEIGALGLKYSDTTRLDFSRQESLLMKFGGLVRQQFREQRMVKNYADQLNVTSKYLTEVIKEYSGKNASDIINYYVILEAKFLLRNTELSIGEIADLLHFSDQSFFGKFFKRYAQLSPKAFRENEISTQ